MNSLLLALCLCSAEFAHGLGHGHGHHGHRGDCPNCAPGDGDDMSFTLVNNNSPCYRGKIFNALTVQKSYMRNQAFAFTHFEDKRITVTTGRIVSLKKKLAVPYVEIDPVTKKAIRNADGTYSLIEKDVFVALVTPTGTIPPPTLNPINGTAIPQNLVGLEFRFPLEALKANPKLACAVADLPAGQPIMVTLTGDCRGAYESLEVPGYTAVIFENASIGGPAPPAP